MTILKVQITHRKENSSIHRVSIMTVMANHGKFTLSSKIKSWSCDFIVFLKGSVHNSVAGIDFVMLIKILS